MLDTSKSYSKHKPSDIMSICVSVSVLICQVVHLLRRYQTKTKYPIVKKYQNYWPVRDMLKLYLKYTSESYRKQGSAFRKIRSQKVG